VVSIWILRGTHVGPCYHVVSLAQFEGAQKQMGHNILVIHPRDHTTRFLELTYRGIDATILTGHVERRNLRGLMEKADQIIMLGHGSSRGLFSVGQFPSCKYVIDSTYVNLLRERDNNVFIWCYATDFVRNNRLHGFATGMFISDAKEAEWLMMSATDTEIQESNYFFANVVGRFSIQRSRVLHAAVDHEYGRLADWNPVAKYNHARIRLFEGGCYGDESLGPRERSVHVHGVAGACTWRQSAGVKT
jgi:hypothetical protein